MTDKTFDIRKAWAALIKHTEHPLAPVIIEEAYQSVDRLARMLTREGSREETDKYVEMMVNGLGPNLEDISRDPNYMMALCAMLEASIKMYVKESMERRK